MALARVVEPFKEERAAVSFVVDNRSDKVLAIVTSSAIAAKAADRLNAEYSCLVVAPAHESLLAEIRAWGVDDIQIP